jgi:hypothetical protein
VTYGDLMKANEDECGYSPVAAMRLRLFLLIAYLTAGIGSSVEGQHTPFISPYFFLCNYDGIRDQSNVDAGEVALSVSIEGNPEYYIPGHLYTGQVRLDVAFSLLYYKFLDIAGRLKVN